jgi:hypothetical protein
MTISFVNGDAVEGFTEGKIPYTVKELADKRYFRKWEKKLAIACGKRCSKCGSNATSTQNKAHGRALRNAGISKVKCRCGRYL